MPTPDTSARSESIMTLWPRSEKIRRSRSSTGTRAADRRNCDAARVRRFSFCGIDRPAVKNSKKTQTWFRDEQGRGNADATLVRTQRPPSGGPVTVRLEPDTTVRVEALSSPGDALAEIPLR